MVYIEIVRESAERSMRAAVDEVKALPHYATSGEVLVMCVLKNLFLLHKYSVGHYRCSA